MRWLVEHTETAGGRLDLRGQRFAILGAAAGALPSAPLLLAAGATVLWIDLPRRSARSPNAKASRGPRSSTTVVTISLASPRAALAAIRRFAERRRPGSHGPVCLRPGREPRATHRRCDGRHGPDAGPHNRKVTFVVYLPERRPARCKPRTAASRASASRRRRSGRRRSRSRVRCSDPLTTARGT